MTGLRKEGWDRWYKTQGKIWAYDINVNPENTFILPHLLELVNCKWLWSCLPLCVLEVVPLTCCLEPEEGTCRGFWQWENSARSSLLIALNAEARSPLETPGDSQSPPHHKGAEWPQMKRILILRDPLLCRGRNSHPRARRDKILTWGDKVGSTTDDFF